jgi:CHAT domain-containing protein/tetratricopeptide (TPR) repeat protein
MQFRAKRGKLFATLSVTVSLALFFFAPSVDIKQGCGTALGAQVAELRAPGEFAEALDFAQQNAEETKARHGESHAQYATSISDLAQLLQTAGRRSEAESLLRRALAIDEKALGLEHHNVVRDLNRLAWLFFVTRRYDEAEPLYRSALSIAEKILGPDHPDVADHLGNLAWLLHVTGRATEAEPLYRSALAVTEKNFGPEHSRVMPRVNSLALLLQTTNRVSEAEPLYRRALAVAERNLAPDHPDLATHLYNLAFFLKATNRRAEADQMFGRLIGIVAKALSSDRPDVTVGASKLGKLLLAADRPDETEPLIRRARAMEEKILGRDHLQVADQLNNLAWLDVYRRNWSGAAEHMRRATAIFIENAHRMRASLGDGEKQLLSHLRDHFKSHVMVIYRANPRDAAARDEAFTIAQRALMSDASSALMQATARFAAGDSDLATLVREQQDLTRRRESTERRLYSALGKADQTEVAALNRQQSEFNRQLDEVIANVVKRFPGFATLVNPEPLDIVATQELLADDEALVQFVDVPQFPNTTETGFAWAITKTAARWVELPPGGQASRRVAALRCGLDEEQWATPTNARRCADLLGLTEVPDPARPLPFDLGTAHSLYQALFSQIEDLIASRRVLIIPSGSLTSLPFHVLVTKEPKTALPETFDGYHDVAWFARSNAITTLPAVSSLRALRQNTADRHTPSDYYAGYGDPLLKGDGGSCRQPKVPEICPTTEVSQQIASRTSVKPGNVGSGRATIRGLGGRRSKNATTDDVYAKGTTAEAVLQQVRSLCPLPDTAYEIKCVAGRFEENGRLIRLGAEANEVDLKALSASGKLGSYRILHLATHGLLSGDVERMAQRQGEPALVLTPPDKPADADDDGLLTASEVAALKLNADWVVLSACNTAAGDKVGAQALSGLARAFFYAGARALLVSHWPVYSDAAVRLTTRAFAELERHPNEGRAEALRHAMIDLIDDHSQNDNAHPAVWAPFVIVGEGGR